MSGRAWLRPALGMVIVAVLVARFGAGPIVRGLRAADGPLLVLALVLTAAATACCAWRWRAVANALEAGIGFGPAYLSCYGAQFLNATLPAGVLGDVHRAVEHGRQADRTGSAVRSVVWERTLGLMVQAVVTLAVVALVPSGLRQVAVVVGIGALLVTGLVVRWVRPVSADLRTILGRPGDAATVVVASLGVAACHTAVLLAAMAATGVDLPAAQTVALALAVLLGSTVPASIAGWGPREGTAAWAFVAVGLPASDGLAVSVAYGVAALVATLPGALGLLFARVVATRRAVAARDVAARSVVDERRIAPAHREASLG